MAEKLKDFVKSAGGAGGGAPRGLGLGVKLLAGAAAAAYGLQQSMYTGNDDDFVNVFVRTVLWQFRVASGPCPVPGISTSELSSECWPRLTCNINLGLSRSSPQSRKHE